MTTKDYNIFKLLTLISCSGPLVEIEKLIDGGINVNSEQVLDLIKLGEKDFNPEVFKLLIKKGLDIKNVTKDPNRLRSLLNNNDSICFEAIKVLKEAGADITNINIVIKVKDPTAFQYLLDNGLNATRFNCCLYLFVNNPAIFKILIKSGAKACSVPLDAAEGFESLYKLLKVYIETDNKDHIQPRHLLKFFDTADDPESRNKRSKILSLFVKNKIALNTVDDKYGYTLLTYAIEKHDKKGLYPSLPDLVKIFIKAGSDVNVKDFLGNTPLFYAFSSSNNDIDLVKFLINIGADKYVTNQYNISIGENAAYEFVDNGCDGEYQ